MKLLLVVLAVACVGVAAIPAPASRKVDAKVEDDAVELIANKLSDGVIHRADTQETRVEDALMRRVSRARWRKFWNDKVEDAAVELIANKLSDGIIHRADTQNTRVQDAFRRPRSRWVWMTVHGKRIRYRVKIRRSDAGGSPVAFGGSPVAFGGSPVAFGGVEPESPYKIDESGSANSGSLPSELHVGSPVDSQTTAEEIELNRILEESRGRRTKFNH